MPKNVDLLLLKGAMYELAPAEQEKVKECAEKLRSVIVEYGDHGLLALALVGIELSND